MGTHSPAQASIEILLERAVRARSAFFESPEGVKHEAAFRLFNGFLEGLPELVVDVYARTLVVMNYAEDVLAGEAAARSASRFLAEALPWVQSVVLKTRSTPDDSLRRGIVIHGDAPSRRVRENGVWYAVDLTMNMDASLYLDTRNLRAWAVQHLGGKRVLNTFAYTGSLGVAATAGGACEVIQLDLNRRFLNLAKDSYALNGFPVRRADFRSGDFWVQASQLARSGELFDCVFVDPPFFSVTGRGTVDLVANSQRVINKVRPLVAHHGWLVAINNALFLSGVEFQQMLNDLCADGYLTLEERIPVPEDFIGYPETRTGAPPVDPAPFNHSTKIAVLRVKRKDERSASAAQ